MNIGMVQSMNSINSSQKLGQVSGKSEGFKNTFASLLQPQGKNNFPSSESADIDIAEVLKKILKILQGGSASDVNALELLDTSKINGEQIGQLMGLTEKDWKDQLSKVMDELFTLLGNNPQYIQQLFAVKKSMNEENYLMGMNELLAIITKAPKDLIQKLNSDQLQFISKSAKAVEVLGKMVDLSKDGLKNLSELKGNIQSLITKVEQLLNTSTSKSRNEILQNTFHNMLINQKEQSQVTPSNKESEIIDQNSNVQTNLQQISKIEQFVLHVGKGAKTVNYQQFVKDFSNILAKSQFIRGEGTSKLLIKLYPEHLGSLRIEVLQNNGILTAKLFAATGAAKDILDSQIHQLKNAFSQQNIQVDKIDILFGQTETQKFERGGQQQQQPFRQPEELVEQELEEESNVQFSDILNQSLIEEKI